VTPALELRGVSSGYRGRAVTWDVDLAVSEGEVTALLGANGAGKTTTLLTASGLLTPLAGEVMFYGQPVAAGRGAFRTARKGLAHVPQDRALFPRLTVNQHLRLPRGYDRDAHERALALFPALTRIGSRRAGLLSGGEQQMLAIARALVSRPKVLIVDELSAGLAPLVVAELLSTVRNLADTGEMAVLLVEQHVEFALRTADRAYVMSNGRVTLSGPAAQVSERMEQIESSYLGSARPGREERSEE
jgi:branched-chain amino acid transport system ATP-binding protein